MIVLNLKIFRLNIWPGQTVQARILDIHDASAFQAHKVMVLVKIRIEARRRAGMAGLGHEPQRHERAENAMDGHAGNLGEPASDRAVELLGGRMVGALED